jgi:6-phosphogluconolactonase
MSAADGHEKGRPMTRLATDFMVAKIRLVTDPQSLAEQASDLLARAVSTGIDQRGWGSLALSGGRTPVETLQRLGRADLNWSQVCVTLVDERWVEPWSADSNQCLLREHLFFGAARFARFIPMKSSAISPLAGIGRHVQAMQTLPLPLDAVLLGMGEDGHFASLFPQSRALREGLDLDSPCSCIAVPEGAGGAAPTQPRMSLTLATIAKARRVVLLTSGEAKLRMLRRALGEICDPTELPVAALLAARPDTVILHDAS